MRSLPALLLAAAAAFGSSAARGADTSPLGLWWAEGGAAQVEIAACDAGLCGRVVWLRSPLDEDGCPMRDERNPEPALRGRELVGVELLRGLRRSRSSPETWADGEIYDPTSGRTYRATLSLDGPRRLLVRGYLGIRLLGRTATWTRVEGDPTCADRSESQVPPGRRPGPRAVAVLGQRPR